MTDATWFGERCWERLSAQSAGKMRNAVAEKQPREKVSDVRQDGHVDLGLMRHKISDRAS